MKRTVRSGFSVSTPSGVVEGPAEIDLPEDEIARLEHVLEGLPEPKPKGKKLTADELAAEEKAKADPLAAAEDAAKK